MPSLAPARRRRHPTYGCSAAQPQWQPQGPAEIQNTSGLLPFITYVSLANQLPMPTTLFAKAVLQHVSHSASQAPCHVFTERVPLLLLLRLRSMSLLQSAWQSERQPTQASKRGRQGRQCKKYIHTHTQANRAKHAPQAKAAAQANTTTHLFTRLCQTH